MPLACGSVGAQSGSRLRAPRRRRRRARWTTAALVQGALAVGQEHLRQRPEVLDAAPEAGEDVGGLAAEDQRRGAGARTPERAVDEVALAGLAVADRDLAGEVQ